MSYTYDKASSKLQHDLLKIKSKIKLSHTCRYTKECIIIICTYELQKKKLKQPNDIKCCKMQSQKKRVTKEMRTQKNTKEIRKKRDVKNN